MSNFTSAHDFSIKNLVQAQNYHVHHQGNSPGRSPLELLRENIASGALHNSAERCDAPKCLPETRVAVQEEILSWITKGDEDREPKKILWLSGPAGSGKTAITGSVAEACKERGLLAASFFFSSFSGSANRRSKRCFVSTLAYQLIQHDVFQPMEETIFSSIQRNPAIFDTRLSDQLESLVLSPLRTLGPRSSAGPKVLIIDGLDECLSDPFDTATWGVQQRKERDQLEILAVLLQAAVDPAFPFRILLASRPEPIIKNFFGTLSQKIHSQIFIDEKYEPDKDIALFLNSKFSEIRRRYGLPQSWPSDAVVNSLVENASGQFIYAATVIRFVDDSSDSPTKQLDRVLRLLQPVDKDTEPFGQLDALYRHVLSSTPNPPLVVVWLVTIQKGIQGFQTEGQIVPAIFCRQFLQGALGEGEQGLLRNLGSLMYIPRSDDTVSSYRLYHKSFMDFLEDPSRHCIPHVKSWWDFFRKRYVAILKGVLPYSTPLMPSGMAY
ncbi:hypothetical protein DFP72DRAFT_1064755 [Ephemerocybe angulata]|uniref:NACHT domain-containing protein n=1 Tax=Ephemerocybe angulata TaxID=980116 RepID=A0A8H6M8B3_9AGAR|nr:hypothetical protein DFP72DRAFT_1064755 [Tulosesus angulatus]